MAKNGADLNIKNNENWTPLHIAVKKGTFDAAEALLKLNDDLLIADLVDIDA